MANRCKCGCTIKANWTQIRFDSCKQCRDREKLVEAIAREEEKLEAEMGPVPDYVR